MTTRRPVTLGCVAVLAALAAPPVAGAATLTPLKACYLYVPAQPLAGTQEQNEPVTLAGDGFTPGGTVDVALDGSPVVTGVPIDAEGRLPAGTLDAPDQPKGERAFTVTVTDTANPANSVSASSRVSLLGVSVSPKLARPSSKVRFRGRGFTDGKRVYAHYRFKGRSRARVSFATKGPCGTFSARKRQIPVSRPGAGAWTVRFDTRKQFSAQPRGSFVNLTIDVSKKVRFSQAAAASAASPSAYLTTARGF